MEIPILNKVCVGKKMIKMRRSKEKCDPFCIVKMNLESLYR